MSSLRCVVAGRILQTANTIQKGQSFAAESILETTLTRQTGVVNISHPAGFFEQK